MTSNNQLIEALRQAASNLSYYNAAEGDSWYKERQARGEALIKYRDACSACVTAGIDVGPIVSKGQYLV